LPARRQFVFDWTEYGAAIEKGNFSFVRLYGRGHQVPYFQRKSIFSLRLWVLKYELTALIAARAAQTLLQRSVLGLDNATGKIVVTGDYATNGTAKATHMESLCLCPLATESRWIVERE
jgi:carboxypeptidase D